MDWLYGVGKTFDSLQFTIASLQLNTNARVKVHLTLIATGLIIGNKRVTPNKAVLNCKP